jgi:putative glycerol-1-phosphate prenyltransferase
LRQFTELPILLFPGNIAQFTPMADALLFLTLLNAQSPDVLINPHIAIAQRVMQSGIESIPMGYILVDGGCTTSVEIATNCHPISQTAVDHIAAVAAAGQLLGKQLIYLEAGSGARTPVAASIIRSVRSHVSVPLIVGGGICTPQAMLDAFDAGADIVVIGNHFEQNPDEIVDFIRLKQQKYG